MKSVGGEKVVRLYQPTNHDYEIVPTTRDTKAAGREPLKLGGLAMRYRTRSLDGAARGEIWEFLPGAFADSLRLDELYLLGHHSVAQPLARRGNGTLFVRDTLEGLFLQATLPPTSIGWHFWHIGTTGVLGGLSAGVSFPRDGYKKVGQQDGVPVYEVSRARLFEISLVTQPAMPGTSIWPEHEGDTPRLSRMRERLAATRSVAMVSAAQRKERRRGLVNRLRSAAV